MSEQKVDRHVVASKQELIEAGKKIVTIDGHEIGVFHVNGEFFAWRNYCPHFAAPVCAGDVCGTRLNSDVYEYKLGLEGQILRCPWHGWEFDLKTGVHLADESVKLRGVELEMDDNYVYIQGRKK
ncbi:Rieske (2Fe-2S) protein [Bacillus sp. Marseille-P3661]|uniref:Rieske (2Fe-2S) protein n=1 Tax=Bacillus sp. Marseille-P3661 TaxID=1936234 RepID=UPI000C84607B|nr:Rieske (2Fe-2S) protein [Bacillus sp. Marseille-P3661]